jgi:hypothetical protein
MSHVRTNQEPVIFCETRAEYRAQQMSETRWDNITQGVSDHDLDNNFDFLNAAVLNRSADDKLLLTTTGLFGAYFCERDRLILRSVTTCTLLSSSQFIL